MTKQARARLSSKRPSAIVFLAVALTFACWAPRAEYDIVFLGGSVFDGSGAAAVLADVGVRDGLIAAVGDLGEASALESIDATGLTIAPGFIDAHSHAELDEDYGRDARAFLAQGITTVALGLDGDGRWDVARQLDAWASDGIGVNGLLFVGHNAIRREVMNMDDRAPTSEELARMKAMVRSAMEEGAFGLSTGLFYTPGNYATTEEVIELAKVAAEWERAIYDTHDRDLGATYQGIGYDASIAEGIRIGEESGLRVTFSHFNPQGATNYGRAEVGARMIEDARARGVEVWAAQHPYTATQSNLRAYALPRWATAGGQDAIMRRFAHPDTLAILRVQMLESLAMRGGPEKIMIVDEDPRLNGRTVAALAAEWGMTVPDALQTVFTDSGNATVMNLDLYDIENTRYLAGMPWMMTCTDGRTPAEGQVTVHPRVYGAFARKMRLFALDENVISVPFAIRSFTGLAADFFGLSDRGYIRPGMRADLAILDLDTYRDMATMEAPHQYAEGAVHVLVNGAFAIRDRAFLGTMAGEPIRASWEYSGDR
ncbi:MAG: amidohydrolase family protein [Gemmatimonadetes bacterium]|nr:amidohydrolase family protein [Gemmatimonadota bacterium]MDA1104508.1 amidohydrolase family protein [Gemmatimonadota bacterium]